MRWSPLLWTTGVLLFAMVTGALAYRGLNRLPGAPGLEVPGGDPQRGRVAIGRYGCGSCHTIPGAGNARGRVGPLLIDYQRQGLIAGRLPNMPHHLVSWIQHPQTYLPGTAMPNLGVPEGDARDIASYLYNAK